MNARQDRWDQSLADSSHGQGNVGPPADSKSGGVELDRTNIFQLNVHECLSLHFRKCTQILSAAKCLRLAQEIDCMIRNRKTPWLSLINVKHRYLVV